MESTISATQKSYLPHLFTPALTSYYHYAYHTAPTDTTHISWAYIIGPRCRPFSLDNRTDWSFTSASSIHPCDTICCNIERRSPSHCGDAILVESSSVVHHDIGDQLALHPVISCISQSDDYSTVFKIPRWRYEVCTSRLFSHSLKGSDANLTQYSSSSFSQFS